MTQISTEKVLENPTGRALGARLKLILLHCDRGRDIAYQENSGTAILGDWPCWPRRLGKLKRSTCTGRVRVAS